MEKNLYHYSENNNSSQKDDPRFYTPRACSSYSSSDEWTTPRADQKTNRSSEGEYSTPRDVIEIENPSYGNNSNYYHNGAGYYDNSRGNRNMTPYEAFSKEVDDDKTDDVIALSISNGITDEEVEDIFSYARHGRVDDIERLLNKGIPLHVRDVYGNSILTTACQNGNKRVAKLLLRRGADINARNYKGNTPLHYCYHYGYGDTLGEYLISKGADQHVRNNEGRGIWDGI